MSNITSDSAYSSTEERLNALSHGVGLIAAVIGLIFMLNRVDGLYSQVVCVIYGLSMMLMFLSSTLYHYVHQPHLKAKLKVFDHCAIYLLIAGTYTPFMVLAVGSWVGLVGMVLVWSIAIVGIAFKCLANGRFPRLSLVTYLIMGWIALFFIYPLYQAVEVNGLWLLLAGGLCYTLGVIFYVQKKIEYTHVIWHLFVVAGCVCHFFSIYLYVI